MSETLQIVTLSETSATVLSIFGLDAINTSQNSLIAGKLTTKEKQIKLNRAMKVTTPKRELTPADLGWSPKKAAHMRMIFGAIAEDWDDPEMDVYDDL
jgi:hypothetical protein